MKAPLLVQSNIVWLNLLFSSLFPFQDVESYIHRAGRTGRAGRNGVSIIFYKQGQEYGVQAVERKAGLKFSRIGAPQQEELIKASADDAVR